MTVVAVDAAPAPTRTDRARWPAWALAAICVAAAALYAWKIGAGQLGNTYYSAAVKSMTGSFSNFLFGSFDPYGVVTVDKPPMSLWPQALSVMIFGFHGWSLLLPQVIEGVAAVFLLHRTVRMWAGENTALLAAAILALTPITVAINRDNNPDTLLVLLLVAAAYAFTRSVRATAGTRWLLLCAFLIGCGFLTKMLQAWIIVPGIALAYFVGTSAPVKRRLLDLLGAGGVLVASSFWWVALHEWWPGDKPYIGGSTDGSAWDLIFGYNGFGRVFGGDGNISTGGGGPPGGMRLPAGVDMPSGGGMGAFGGGSPGLTRMFDESVGGQISWLLPLALLVLAVVAVAGVLRMRAKLPGNPFERAGWFLWGSWLLVTALVFSYAEGIWHPYYTTMLAPAIAAIAAAGLVRFWRAYRDSTGVGWVLLPLAVTVTAVWAFVLASRDTSWHGWTRWAVVLVAAVAVGGLVAGRLTPATLGRPALVVGLVAVLLVPAVWSTAAATTTQSGTIPAAGPAGGFGGFSGSLPAGMSLPGMPSGTNPFPGGGLPSSGQPSPGGGLPSSGQPSPGGGLPGTGQPSPGGGQPSAGSQLPGGMSGGMAGMVGGDTELTADQRRILDYAEQHSDGAAITLAVNSPATMAASYIIGSDATVIGMGGFGGADDAPSVDQLARWSADGELRFVLSGSGGGFMGQLTGTNHTQERHEWIERHCEKVDPSAYGGSTDSQEQSAGLMGAQTLYDCRS
jgi:4-amino-4-deoxy-L-arabinose transferase-like glycosyltransferase